MSKGKWKPRPLCYKGPIPTFDSFVRLYMFVRCPKEEVLREKYDSFIADTKKTNFQQWRKSNYDLIVKAGLYQRQKRLIPRFKK